MSTNMSGRIIASALTCALFLLSVNDHVCKADTCPSISADSLCKCADGKFGKRIICSQISSEVDLDRVIRCNSRFHAEEFVVDNSELRYISHETFQGSSYELLDIRDTSLTALSDRKLAFVGLEESLKQITISRCTFTTHWDWSQLKNLKNLEAIEVFNSDIEYPVGFESLSMDSLHRILLTGNSELTTLPDNAFANMKRLSHLLLPGNGLTSVSRSMFPRSLAKLDLSHNKIKTLSEGVFKDLPYLIQIHIQENLLHTIDEKVFKDVWAQLILFDFRDNQLVCDCRLKWILKASQSPHATNIVCDRPNDLKGRALKSLKPGELYC